MQMSAAGVGFDNDWITSMETNNVRTITTAKITMSATSRVRKGSF